MVGMEKRKEPPAKGTKDAQALEQARFEAAHGIAFGLHAMLRGPTNIESVELGTERITTAFASNPDVSRGTGSMTARVIITIPHETEERHEDASDSSSRLKSLLRTINDEDEDFSGN